MKTIYLAGGCYWGVEKYISCFEGIEKTEVGFANGFVVAPSYDTVKHTETGHAETVKVDYDETSISLKTILHLFFKIIDPTILDRQGHDEGHQYRTGIYYTNEDDGLICKEALIKLQESYKEKIVTECELLKCFYPAEEYHQKYLDKNPNGYCHVPLAQISWAKNLKREDYDK